jgi:hypothetical protein
MSEMDKVCPKCKQLGSGPHERPVSKGGKYTGYYFAHSREHVGRNHKIKWCYLTHEMASQLVRNEIQGALEKLEQVEAE